METYCKLVNKNGGTPQGYGQWPLEASDWLPPIKGKLILCKNAYHVLTVEQLLSWSPWTEALLEIEIGKERITDGEKTGVRWARVVRIVEQWNDAVLRLLAVECAERVIHLYEEKYPSDERPRKALQAARDFARGKIDTDALAAAGAAAWAASGAAAWAAAWAAARDAAGAAARAAAGDAARDAAWAAARDAARAAAGAAAWDAAGDAARAAERQWQAERLGYYLNTQLG